MNTLKFMICFLIINVSFSQSQHYETGNIINAIEVQGTTNETFALYLPKSYDKKAASAIVFIFDPSGNGVKGLKPFTSSADRFNYILVCSNNSKNGPYQSNFDITNRLFLHIFSTFHIDKNQIYTAGFSGGSRLASTIAVLTGAIQGVIACGAGFAGELDYKPSAESKFSYVGLVGDEDMNYQEMIIAKSWLDRFNIDNALFIYEDGHHWPPQVQIEKAFTWLELQAYKKQLRQTDTVKVKSFYKADFLMADSLSKHQSFRAIMTYNHILKNYDSYVKLDSMHDKKIMIKASEAYKQDFKYRNEIAEKEQQLSRKFLKKFSQESFYGESQDHFKWWEKELKKLDANTIKADNDHLNKMGKRLRFRLMALAYETAIDFERSGRLDKVLYCNKLLTKLHPERAYFYFRLAETYAKASDAKNTRVNLKLATEKGFDNLSLIKANPLFLKFKEDKKFAAFLSSLK